jgi:hypothetical protein
MDAASSNGATDLFIVDDGEILSSRGYSAPLIRLDALVKGGILIAGQGERGGARGGLIELMLEDQLTFVCATEYQSDIYGPTKERVSYRNDHRKTYPGQKWQLLISHSSQYLNHIRGECSRQQCIYSLKNFSSIT